MNKDRLQVELLDRVQSSIEKQIFSYEVEEIEDIFNEDDDVLKSIFHDSPLKKSTFGATSSNHTFYLKNDAIYYSSLNTFVIKINSDFSF